MRTTGLAAIALLWLIGPAVTAARERNPVSVPAEPSGRAGDLKSATLAAYDRYVALTEARMARELAGGSPFLWIDRQPDAARREHLAGMARGEVVVERLETLDGRRGIDVPDGVVHHWIGTVLLPGVALDRAVAFVQDYARYPSLFAPLIQSARVVNRAGDRFDVRMRTSMKKMMVTVVLEGDYTIEYRPVGSARVYTRNIASNLVQIHDAGEPGERREPVDNGSGWLWRIATYCSFEQRAEGTYEQCESVSLTRGIPFGVAWIVKPFVSGIPRESLAFTLGQVRTALRGS
jgi:hypothetical protein